MAKLDLVGERRHQTPPILSRRYLMLRCTICQPGFMQSSSPAEMLSAREAAERLGIKLDTLYAYVSRGMLGSVTVPGSRERRYRAEDVERFRSSRGERGGPAEALMPVIGSSICLIEDGRLYYRGHDAVRLAESAALEEIADLLWGEVAISSAPTPTLPRKRGRGSSVRTSKPVPPKRGRVLDAALVNSLPR